MEATWGTSPATRHPGYPSAHGNRLTSDTPVYARRHLLVFRPSVGRSFLKTRVGVAEDEMDAVGGAVALFGDQNLGLGALFGGFIGLESIWAVDEHHDVGVLLDGAGFAEVGKLRAAVFAFRGACELGEAQHRDFQFLRH